MTFILENLYIGGIDDVVLLRRLTDPEKYPIKSILTIDCRPLTADLQHNSKYNYIHALDLEHFDLLTHFPQCIHCIDEGRNAGGILVHCHAGVSRSVTVVTAYLMSKLNMKCNEALQFISSLRPQSKPNAGFVNQLRLFEEMGNIVNETSDTYRRYRLKILSNQMSQIEQSVSLLKGALVSDPLQNSAKEVLYKCRKCRRPLFSESCIMTHEQGAGHDLLINNHTKKNIGATTDQCTETSSECRTSTDQYTETSSECRMSLFIEPVEWMANDILNLNGKINCVKCSAKLGSFNWAGEPCPCGQWVTPAFHIQTSKVDRCQIHPVRTQLGYRQPIADVSVT